MDTETLHRCRTTAKTALADAGVVSRGAVHLARTAAGRVPLRRLGSVVRLLPGARFDLGFLYTLNAVAHPDFCAVVDAAGPLDYGDLNARVNRLAHHLLAVGASTGRLVYLLPNCREAVEAMGAAAKLGMDPVPVNTRFQAEEVRYLLDHQQPAAVVVDESLQDRVAGWPGPVLVRGDSYEAALADAADTEPAPPSRESHMVIHTSGTTGHPKGAERRMEAMGRLSILGFLGTVPVACDDRMVVPAPMFHSLGMGLTTMALALGATAILPERFDAEGFLRDVETYRASAAVVVPVMLQRLVQLPREVQRRYDVSSLRWVLVSGSMLPPTLEAAVREVLGPVLYNLYGSTEAGWVSVATPGDAAERPGTVGRRLPGLGLRVVDGGGAPLEGGEDGEIVIGGGTLFDGYTGTPYQDRWYPIGDMGHLDEGGYLYVADRKDDMVVTGGENVYPAEVERVLEGHPGLAEVAVYGIDDSEYGKVLCASVGAKAGESLDPAEVEAYCRDRIANYKVPKHIWVTDALPWSVTGKILRRQLVREAEARLRVPGA